MLNPGIKGSASVAVTAANTAAAMGSGELNVFATPALAALVEKACWQSVAPELDPGCGPVGTKLDLLRADPNVSFEADCPGTVSGGATSCTYGMNYQSVIGRGTVRFVEGGEKLTALQALMQHYHCPDLPFEPEMVEHTTVLALDVAAMTGKRRTSF